MSDKRIISFPYRSIDGVLQPSDCYVSLYADSITIIGEKRHAVFCPVKKRSIIMKGLFIAHKGIEYGTMSLREADLIILIQGCLCAHANIRLFDVEFDFEFE